MTETQEELKQEREDRLAVDAERRNLNKPVPELSKEEQIELVNLAMQIIDNPKLLAEQFPKPVYEMEEKEQLQWFFTLSEYYKRAKQMIAAVQISSLDKLREKTVEDAARQKRELKKKELKKGMANPEEFKKTLVKRSQGDKELASLRKTCVTMGVELPENFMDLNKAALKNLLLSR